MVFAYSGPALPLPEGRLIERIRRIVRQHTGRSLVRGIGDDCAILQAAAGHQLLITTDLCVEDVHFRRDWHPPGSVGHRCLVRGLSDIAAMGGEPAACFLSLALPPRLPQKWVDGFLKGFGQLAQRWAVPLAGGDVSAASTITADIVVAGQAPSGMAILRSGARPGDRIYVTGDLGGPAAVLKRLYAGERVQPSRSSRHFYPEPRLPAGLWLRRKGRATAMIDLSDGLSIDLAHVCRESGVSAKIHAGALPVAKGADLASALHGGEDYELLFTAPATAKIPGEIAGVRTTQIGVIGSPTRRGSAIRIVDETGGAQFLPPGGWSHFNGKRMT